MDIRQLRYFLTIAEKGSITEAAKDLHMSQPPLSQQLKLLEDELGVKLVERGSRKIQLTPAGKILKIRAEHILEFVETTIKEIKDFKGGVQGSLTIGTISSLGATILTEHIQRFNNEFPNVDFQLWDGDSLRLLDLLNSGVVEIGFIRGPFDSEIFDSIPLPNEPMVATISEHLLKSNNTQISLKDLEHIPLILIRRYKKHIVKACLKYGFEPKIQCESDDVRSILLLAHTGIGAGIVPKSSIGIIPYSDFKYFEVIEPIIAATPSIIWMKNRYLSAAARHFLDTFVE